MKTYYKNTIGKKSNTFQSNIKKSMFALAIMLLNIFAYTANAQEVTRQLPKFWLGVSSAANFNFYSGTSQRLNADVIAPTAFHKGNGLAPFASILAEYRPNPVLGFMLNVGYDGRGSSFKDVIAPCNCPSSLKTNLSYITIEPGIRLSPFSNGFHLFLAGRIALLHSNSFYYTQKQTPKTDYNSVQGTFSETNKTIFSGSVGMGYDIPLSSPADRTQSLLTPFISYHPYFGQAPRKIESWSIQTLRAGIALKFGRGPAVAILENPIKKDEEVKVVVPVVGASHDIVFAVRAPLLVPAKRKISESFPLRNYVFFNDGSSDIPNRYVKLNTKQGTEFREAQLQEFEPKDLSGRSNRQMNVYHNILNILGDRMRTNPSANITLIGASAGNGPELGKEYAESIKLYLVNTFGIAANRITTMGRNQPIIPSEHSESQSEIELLREGDRRVDIVSNSSDLMVPLHIKAVLTDPMDARIIFKADAIKGETLQSWTVKIKDEKGVVHNYGPYTKPLESISAKEILGDKSSGNYNVTLIGKTKENVEVRKDTTLHLERVEAPEAESLRYSILFDFNKGETVATYETFIKESIVPLVTNNSTVIIHGHTDVIGSEEYNMKLSLERANDALDLLKTAINRAGKTGVKYELYGFGEDNKTAPFDNSLPEERFYNRTVIIDVIPAK